jgi:hypothetical protein
MAQNGISTLPTKAARVAAKLAAAQAKRAATGTVGYRALHTIDNPQVDPPRPTPLNPGRPWK